MVLRIWTLLIAVMLMASPEAVACAEVDTACETVADETWIEIAVVLPVPRTIEVPLTRHDEPLPPSPALGRIFRPPRSPVV